jgi:hypothetical protein
LAAEIDRVLARLGAHIVMFADRPWAMRLPAIERGCVRPTVPDRMRLRVKCVTRLQLIGKTSDHQIATKAQRRSGAMQ